MQIASLLMLPVLLVHLWCLSPSILSSLVPAITATIILSASLGLFNLAFCMLPVRRVSFPPTTLVTFSLPWDPRYPPINNINNIIKSLRTIILGFFHAIMLLFWSLKLKKIMNYIFFYEIELDKK